MFDSLQDLIQANNRALEALNQCMARLVNMRVGASVEELSLIQDQISMVTSEIDLLRDINIQLEAADVPFTPLDAATQQQLRDSFDKVDKAIVRNAIISATIDTINDVFEAVSKIGDITNGAA